MATKPQAKPHVIKDAQTTIVCENGNCHATDVTVSMNGKVTIFSPDFDCKVQFDTLDYFHKGVKNPSPVGPSQPLELHIKDKKGTVSFTAFDGPCGPLPQKALKFSPSSTASGGSILNSSNQIVIDS
jgi:hypothetical protein